MSQKKVFVILSQHTPLIMYLVIFSLFICKRIFFSNNMYSSFQVEHMAVGSLDKVLYRQCNLPINMTGSHHKCRWLKRIHMYENESIMPWNLYAYRELCNGFRQDDGYRLIHANRSDATRAKTCQFERDLSFSQVRYLKEWTRRMMTCLVFC